MKGRSRTFKSLPLQIVGSTTFGRYPKISVEQTFNMIISDNFLVPYAGHKKISSISSGGVGRALYSSNRLGLLIAVVDSGVYIIDDQSGFSAQLIGTLETNTGDVFIDENNANQIAICDKKDIWIYTTPLVGPATFTKAVINFVPGYITFQDTYFIAPDLNSDRWRLSGNNDGLSWPTTPNSEGRIQTKPTLARAALRVPGKGNLLFVFGTNVTELWTDVGAQIFPYQRSSSVNIDYGCLNQATIGSLDEIVCWLGTNEKSGPVIMVSQGGSISTISNDGINFKLAQLTKPENSFGFMFKQDGHIFYQLTFPSDNLTFSYDFNTQKFFSITDEYMNYHIARKVAFFNNTYYFVSIKDNNLYEINTIYTDYNGKEIPRVRVCSNIRMPDQSRFVVNNVSFTMEQGEIPYTNSLLQPVLTGITNIPRVDFTMSKDGGANFSNTVSKDLNNKGLRQNRLRFYRCGIANDFVPQFRFFGFGRFVVTDGLVEIYQ